MERTGRAAIATIALLSLLAGCGGGGGGAATIPQANLVGGSGTGGGPGTAPGGGVDPSSPTPPPAGGVSLPATPPPSTPDPGLGSTPPPPPGTPAPPSPSTPTPSPLPGSTLTFTGLGGYQGDAYVQHQDGDSYEYSESVVLNFDRAIDLNSFVANYSITPATAVSASYKIYKTGVILTMRKTPGVTYTISVPGNVQAADGSTLGQPVSVTVTSPAAVTIPIPIASRRNQPYFYGILGHPWTLGGANGAQYISAIANSGARNVRIDYAATNIEASKGTFNFAAEDAIMDKLAAQGITELPIILQYSAPGWATGGHGYPSIFADPTDYAAFAGAVAAHVSQRYPQITRIELFNEPNLHGWWSYPVAGGTYDDRSGAATAVYMKAAYAAIKKANPQLTVVGPALATGGWHTNAAQFLQTMYNHGCRTGSCWDVMSIHNYAWINPSFYNRASRENRWDNYKMIQQVAAQNGDGTPHVMLTEAGWSHSYLPNAQDPAVQAQYIALGFNMILDDPTIDGVTYVNVYNTGSPSDVYAGTGLLGDGFTQLQPYSVFREFASM